MQLHHASEILANKSNFEDPYYFIDDDTQEANTQLAIAIGEDSNIVIEGSLEDWRDLIARLISAKVNSQINELF